MGWFYPILLFLLSPAEAAATGRAGGLRFAKHSPRQVSGFAPVETIGRYPSGFL